MTLVNSVRQKISKRCIGSKCQRQGCRVTLKGVPKGHIIVDMDCHIDPNQVRCDFLFVGRLKAANAEWVIPMELKRGQVNASGVMDQLQAGAKAAERLVPQKADVEFQPIVASGRINPEQNRILGSKKVVFRGKKFAIRRIECGSSLTTAI